jgi:hypothetical protein
MAASLKTNKNFLVAHARRVKRLFSVSEGAEKKQKIGTGKFARRDLKNRVTTSRHLSSYRKEPLFRKAPQQAVGSAIDPHNKVLPRLTFINASYKQRGLINIAAELDFQFRCSRSRTLQDLVVPFFYPPEFRSVFGF